jgi:hypothetical protein
VEGANVIPYVQQQASQSHGVLVLELKLKLQHRQIEARCGQMEKVYFTSNL